MMGLTVVVSVCCLLIGFALGRDGAISERVSAALLSKDLDVKTTAMDEIQARLIEAELSATVHRNAADEVRADLQQLHAQLETLRQEVAFYKSLMAPGEMTQGLQIKELELQAGESERSYRFQLLLTQIARRRAYISGSVRIELIGSQPGGEPGATDVSNGDQVVLPLTEVSALEAYPVKFKFRYFQDIAGQINLPEGFTPESIAVVAQQQGKDAKTVLFPWPSETS